MKQIITLLLVILVSIPVNAQQTIKQKNQELENEKTARLTGHNQINSHMFSNYQARNLLLKRKTEFLKTLEIKYLDSLIYQDKIEESNFWRNTIKKVFTYKNEKIDKITLFNWDEVNSNWVPSQVSDYTFDENGNLITEIQSTNVSSIQWTSEKIIYSYFINANNQYSLEDEIHYAWDINKSEWVYTNKYELTYESYGVMLTKEQCYEWSNTLLDWVNFSKHEYFPQQPFQDYDVISNWNIVTSQWEPVSKSEYSRDDFHPWVPDYVILYNWDAGSGYWIKDFKYEYEYDFGGPDAFPRQTRVTGSDWDTSTNQWKKDYKDDYVYDWWESSDQSSTSTYFEWDESTNKWEPLYKDEFIFDFIDWNYDVISPLGYIQEFDDAPWWTYYLNLLIGYRNYEYTNTIWEDRTSMFLYYSNYSNPLEVEEPEIVNSIKVYPNPVIDFLFVDSEIPLTKVEIYSIFGKKLKEIDNGFEAIPMYNMADGIYIVKVRAENKIMFKKIIKTTLNL